jgi:hypothetical protein
VHSLVEFRIEFELRVADFREGIISASVLVSKLQLLATRFNSIVGTQYE